MFSRVATPASSPSSTTQRTCGHSRHVGSCGTCQRLQLERWSLQLAQVTRPLPQAAR
jgi:hypothetical protein